jgi:DNA invertase Pin-like site-specific DNA recombinase
LVDLFDAKSHDSYNGTGQSTDDDRSVALPFSSRVVGYYRVSTERPGRSGSGLAAQEEAVRRHCVAFDCELVGAYTEVESGAMDSFDNRPALQRAIAHARRSKAILVIAKLDRLARSVYVTALLHRSGVEFIATDMPTASKMTIQFMAVVAEGEARTISERTKNALSALKSRGVLLGSRRPECRYNLVSDHAAHGRNFGARRVRELAQEAYADLFPVMKELRDAGTSLRAVARSLNAQGHTTRRGFPWTSVQVGRVLARKPD